MIDGIRSAAAIMLICVLLWWLVGLVLFCLREDEE